MSELMDLMRSVQKGETPVEDVAADFKTRSWPKVAVTPDDPDAAFTAEQSDREPDPPGSFSEVAGAYYMGVITIDQYSVLAEAAAEGMKTADVPATPDTATDTDPAADVTEPVTEEDPDKDVSAGQEPVADAKPGDKPTDKPEDTPEDPDKPAPGKPKKGVNPFPKKG